MEKSFGLFFFLRISKKEKGLERNVYMHLTTVSTVFDVSSAKRKCDRDKWNQDAGRMWKKYEESSPFNELTIKLFFRFIKLINFPQIYNSGRADTYEF